MLITAGPLRAAAASCRQPIPHPCNLLRPWCSVLDALELGEAGGAEQQLLVVDGRTALVRLVTDEGLSLQWGGAAAAAVEPSTPHELGAVCDVWWNCARMRVSSQPCLPPDAVPFSEILSAQLQCSQPRAPSSLRGTLLQLPLPGPLRRLLRPRHPPSPPPSASSPPPTRRSFEVFTLRRPHGKRWEWCPRRVVCEAEDEASALHWVAAIARGIQAVSSGRPRWVVMR